MLLISLSPPGSVHKGVSVFHTLHQHPELFLSSVMPTAGNGHTTVATMPPRGLSHPSHLSLLPAQGKSQCHLPSSGSGAFLFMSVHLGHSPSELIVLFFYRFFCLFVLKKKEFSSRVPLQLQVRQSHPVFHQHNIWPKLVCALLHCSQDAEEPLVQGIQVRLGEHR